MKLSLFQKNSLYLIAGYFWLDAFANLILLLSPYLPGHDLINSLAGILSNDPFTHGVIIALPFYSELMIVLKGLLISGTLSTAGYYLIQKKLIGWYLGLFIAIFGLGVSTTSLFRENPLIFLMNIREGMMVFGFGDISWFIMGVVFLINVYTVVFLLINRKLFR